MSKQWNKLNFLERHDRHNELVKASFHTEPHNG